MHTRTQSLKMASILTLSKACLSENCYRASLDVFQQI